VDIKQYLPYCLGRKALIEIKTNNIWTLTQTNGYL